MTRKMQGTVYIEEWGEVDGEPIDLSFVSRNGVKYRIAKNANWQRLKAHFMEKVVAYGVVYFDKSDDGREQQTFLIKRFHVVRDDTNQELHSVDDDYGDVLKQLDLGLTGQSYFSTDFIVSREFG